MTQNQTDRKLFILQKRNLAALLLTVVLTLALIAGVIYNSVIYSKGNLDPYSFQRRISFAGINVLMFVLIFAVQWIFRIRFPLFLELSLIVFAFACLAGGTVFGLYTTIPVWDKVLHTASGFLFSAVGLTIARLLLRKDEADAKHIIATVLIAFFFSLAVGYVWEIYEYTLDSLSTTSNLQRWAEGVLQTLPDGTYVLNDRRGTALHDTLGDMIVNFIGTVVFLVPMLVLFFKKPKTLTLFDVEMKPKTKTAEKTHG